ASRRVAVEDTERHHRDADDRHAGGERPGKDGANHDPGGNGADRDTGFERAGSDGSGEPLDNQVRDGTGGETTHDDGGESAAGDLRGEVQVDQPEDDRAHTPQ